MILSPKSALKCEFPSGWGKSESEGKTDFRPASLCTLLKSTLTAVIQGIESNHVTPASDPLEGFWSIQRVTLLSPPVIFCAFTMECSLSAALHPLSQCVWGKYLPSPRHRGIRKRSACLICSLLNVSYALYQPRHGVRILLRSYICSGTCSAVTVDLNLCDA